GLAATIQDLVITSNTLTITNNPTATPIDLTPYLDNTDDQNAEEVPVTATPTNYVAATQDVEAHLAGIDAALTVLTTPIKATGKIDSDGSIIKSNLGMGPEVITHNPDTGIYTVDVEELNLSGANYIIQLTLGV